MGHLPSHLAWQSLVKTWTPLQTMSTKFLQWYNMKGWEPEWSIPQLNVGNSLKCPKMKEKNGIPPSTKVLKFPNYWIFSSSWNGFWEHFRFGGYNQEGRRLDHFASEPFNTCVKPKLITFKNIIIQAWWYHSADMELELEQFGWTMSGVLE